MSGSGPASADALVIVADFTTTEANKAAFIVECEADARGSMGNEPGCRQFDVLVAEDGSGGVTLLEVYDDAAAFDAHRQTPHYARFAEAVKRLGLPAPIVRRLSRLHRGAA